MQREGAVPDSFVQNKMKKTWSVEGIIENKGQCELLEIKCYGCRSGDDRVEVLGEWVCKARQGLLGFAVRGLPRLG
jgi:hypothetical protein